MVSNTISAGWIIRPGVPMGHRRPPFRPPFRDEARDSFLPRPEPDFLPPPDSLLTVAYARLLASLADTPRFS